MSKFYVEVEVDDPAPDADGDVWGTASGAAPHWYPFADLIPADRVTVAPKPPEGVGAVEIDGEGTVWVRKAEDPDLPGLSWVAGRCLWTIAPEEVAALPVGSTFADKDGDVWEVVDEGWVKCKARGNPHYSLLPNQPADNLRWWREYAPLTLLTAPLSTWEREPLDGPGPDPVERPEHYRAGMPEGVEVIDVIRAQGGGGLHGNVIKYVLRAQYKGNLVEDYRKARRYLDWLIEEAERGE